MASIRPGASPLSPGWQPIGGAGDLAAAGAADLAAKGTAPAASPQGVGSASARAADLGGLALGGALLREGLELATRFSETEKASLASVLDVAFAPVRLAVLAARDPGAAETSLRSAAAGSAGVLGSVKGLAQQLLKNPGGIVEQALRDGPGRVLGGAERALDAGGPVARKGGAVAGGREIGGARVGRVDGPLGSSVTGGAAGKAGATGSAAGDVYAGRGSAGASGHGKLSAGASGEATGEARGPLGARLRGTAYGKGGASGEAKGHAKVGLSGASASGAAGFDEGIEGGIRTKASSALGSVEENVRVAAGQRGEAAGGATLDVTGLKTGGKARYETGLDVEKETKVRTGLANVNIAGKGSAKAYGEVGADAKVGLTGASGKAKGEVGESAEIKIDADFRTAGVQVGGERVDVNGTVHAEGHVSAKAEAEVDVAVTAAPPRAIFDGKAGAFAGAKAGASGKIGIGEFVSLKGHGGAWAGAGAEAALVAGYDKGKLRFGFNAGAAWGVGYGGGVGVEVDIAAIASAAVGGTIESIEKGLKVAADPTRALSILAADIGTIFVGPGEKPRDYGTYPQLALLFPPQVFSQGADAADADRAAGQLESTVRRLARDARTRPVSGARE